MDGSNPSNYMQFNVFIEKLREQYEILLEFRPEDQLILFDEE